MAHIILIEPDRILADTYRQAIETKGHTVTMCASAQAGVMAADESKPDLVIVELQLVEHSGIEFLYEFRSYHDWQSIPIIIHSQVPSTEFNGSKALLERELNVENYLYKPRTTLNHLISAVQEQLVAVAV